jgi:hypothetical protein
VRQKLIAAIDGIAHSSDSKSEKCLLYLPENELHEINLLFANLVLKRQGLKTIYLGQSVPYNDIKMVCDLHQPTYIITVITCPLADISIESYLDQLSQEFPQQKILVSGYQFSTNDIKLPAGVKLFNSPKELLSHIS